ncbi:MAG: RNA polymerase sigma factor SigB [Acidimicrobiales bacterium]|nr:RNA polymerase sigma factor SigB [Acidimicrobiales bacterium]
MAERLAPTYLDGLARVSLLTAAEERDLAQRIEKGARARHALEEGADESGLEVLVADAERARTRFLTANLRLVISIANRIARPPTMDFADLVQEGNIGLDHAIDKFDWRRGYKFSTYATWWIRQSISRAIDQQASLIRPPSDRAARIRAHLKAAGGDPARLDPRDAALHRLMRVDYLDRPRDSSEAGQPEPVPDAGPDPAETASDRHLAGQLRALVDGLPDRDRRAIIARFGLDGREPMTYAGVAGEIGMTTEATRQLVMRTLKHLRDEHGHELTAAA